MNQLKDKKMKKHLIFHCDDPREIRVFVMLDKVRYDQSRLIINLLDEFFNKFGIDENTSSMDMKFAVKAFLDRSHGISQVKINTFNEIIRRRQIQ